MLDGISFAGFNMVDIKKLHKKTGLPVIAVTRKKTDFKKFRQAMRTLPGFERRWEAVESAGKLHELKLRRGKVYYQETGLQKGQAEHIIRITSTRSVLPEPIRIAHMVASAIVRGESVGRA
jgi:hypothetical protein